MEILKTKAEHGRLRFVKGLTVTLPLPLENLVFYISK